MTAAPLPSASVIIPTCAGARTIEAAIHSLLKSDYPDFEIIVVDNAADAPTREALARLPESVKVIHSENNLGFSGGNNLGLAHATGEIIALLNDDTEVRPDWLRQLVQTLHDIPAAGLAASLVLEPDGEHIQHSGSYPLDNQLNNHFDKGRPLSEAPTEPIERDYIMAAAIAMCKDLLVALGGLPECYFPGYYEDYELSHRIRAVGLKIIVQPAAILVHHEKQSTRIESAYLRLYHRHRWLFVWRNLSPSEILRTMLAEVKWVINITRWRDFCHYRPLLHAYLWNLLRLPKTLLDRFRLKRENKRIRQNLRA